MASEPYQWGESGAATWVCGPAGEVFVSKGNGYWVARFANAAHAAAVKEWLENDEPLYEIERVGKRVEPRLGG
jgi:hypothetical protein